MRVILPILLVPLVIAILLTSGCTTATGGGPSLDQTPTSSPTTPVPETSVPVSREAASTTISSTHPATTTMGEPIYPVGNFTPPSTMVVQETIAIIVSETGTTVTSPTESPSPTITKVNRPANPSFEIVSIKSGNYVMDNCTMMQLLPECTDDPNYGLRSTRNNSLLYFSTGDFMALQRLAVESETAFWICTGVPETPYWDFIELNAVVTARNNQPTWYNVTTFAWFRGVEAGEYTIPMRLNPGQVYPVTYYVPIRVEEIPEIHTFGFRFEPIE